METIYEPLIQTLQQINESIVQLFMSYRLEEVAIPVAPIILVKHKPSISHCSLVIATLSLGAALLTFKYRKSIEQSITKVYGSVYDYLTCKSLNQRIDKLEAEYKSLKLIVDGK